MPRSRRISAISMARRVPISRLRAKRSCAWRRKARIPGFAGFKVGLADEPVEPLRTPIEETARSNARGKAKLVIPVTEPETSLPLEAEFILTANENGGRGVTRTLVLPIVPKGVAIGVKPLFNPRRFRRRDGEIRCHPRDGPGQAPRAHGPQMAALAHHENLSVFLQGGPLDL